MSIEGPSKSSFWDKFDTFHAPRVKPFRKQSLSNLIAASIERTYKRYPDLEWPRDEDDWLQKRWQR